MCEGRIWYSAWLDNLRLHLQFTLQALICSSMAWHGKA